MKNRENQKPSQYVHPKHPPHQKYRDDGPGDVNDPVTSRFRFSKIEHAAMVAGPSGRVYGNEAMPVRFQGE
jgi:hypothetical protein